VKHPDRKITGGRNNQCLAKQLNPEMAKHLIVPEKEMVTPQLKHCTESFCCLLPNQSLRPLSFF